MPTYDYYCRECGPFEHFQNISDPPLTSCPQCSGEVTRRISGGTGVIFKGSGFFNTDRRKERERQGGTSGKSGTADTTPSSAEAKKEAV